MCSMDNALQALGKVFHPLVQRAHSQHVDEGARDKGKD